MSIIENLKKLPELYSQEENKDPQCPVRLTSEGLPWGWYPIEADPLGPKGEIIPREKADKNSLWLCFGFVDGDFPEWGYFTSGELQSIKAFLDPEWTPKRASLVPNNALHTAE